MLFIAVRPEELRNPRAFTEKHEVSAPVQEIVRWDEYMMVGSTISVSVSTTHFPQSLHVRPLSVSWTAQLSVSQTVYP